MCFHLLLDIRPDEHQIHMYIPGGEKYDIYSVARIRETKENHPETTTAMTTLRVSSIFVHPNDDSGPVLYNPFKHGIAYPYPADKPPPLTLHVSVYGGNRKFHSSARHVTTFQFTRFRAVPRHHSSYAPPHAPLVPNPPICIL